MPEYIEREALLNEAKKRAKAFSSALIYEAIKEAPAADVVEVVYGHWIITEEILETIRECSRCHCKTYYPKPLSFNVRKSPYCEDCGAKMAGSDINVTTNNGWISVKDRLPDNPMERVLVHIKEANGIMGLPNIDTDRYLEGDWVRWIENVTHWQPLPEPPKGAVE